MTIPAGLEDRAGPLVGVSSDIADKGPKEQAAELIGAYTDCAAKYSEIAPRHSELVDYLEREYGSQEEP